MPLIPEVSESQPISLAHAKSRKCIPVSCAMCIRQSTNRLWAVRRRLWPRLQDITAVALRVEGLHPAICPGLVDSDKTGCDTHTHASLTLCVHTRTHATHGKHSSHVNTDTFKGMVYPKIKFVVIYRSSYH